MTGDLAPTSSRKTREGEEIFSSLLAICTAFRAAVRMADTTEFCPDRIPAARPFMALMPMERSVVLVRDVEAALRTLLPMVPAEDEKLYPLMAEARPEATVVP